MSIETTEIVVKLPKEAYELGLAFAKIYTEVKKAAADGIGVEDIPAAIQTVTSKEVVEGVLGFEKIQTEAGEDKTGVIAAFAFAATLIK
jgi:hypothetical protein